MTPLDSRWPSPAGSATRSGGSPADRAGADAGRRRRAAGPDAPIPIVPRRVTTPRPTDLSFEDMRLERIPATTSWGRLRGRAAPDRRVAFGGRCTSCTTRAGSGAVRRSSSPIAALPDRARDGRPAGSRRDRADDRQRRLDRGRRSRPCRRSTSRSGCTSRRRSSRSSSRVGHPASAIRSCAATGDRRVLSWRQARPTASRCRGRAGAAGSGAGRSSIGRDRRSPRPAARRTITVDARPGPARSRRTSRSPSRSDADGPASAGTAAVRDVRLCRVGGSRPGLELHAGGRRPASSSFDDRAATATGSWRARCVGAVPRPSRLMEPRGASGGTREAIGIPSRTIPAHDRPPPERPSPRRSPGQVR